LIVSRLEPLLLALALSISHWRGVDVSVTRAKLASFEAGIAAGLLGCVAASLERCRRFSNAGQICEF
jgi:hypothetical protein